MVFEEAFYGDKGGAHALLSYSGRDPIVFQRLLPYTDRGLPIGFSSLPPSLTALRIGEKYVISQLRADETASRTGMTFTHAVAISTDCVSKINNLRPILERFSPSFNRQSIAESFQISDELLQASLISNSEPNLDGITLAAALRTASKHPVVFQEDAPGTFAAVLPSLWEMLHPNLRSHLTFRLGFSPQEEDVAKYAIIVVPASVINRWKNFSIFSAGESVAEAASDPWMLEGPQKDPLASFASALGAEITDFHSIAMIERAYKYSTKAPESAMAARSYVQLLNHLSPIPEMASDVKESAMSELARLTQDGEFSDIVGLRTIGQPQAGAGQLATAIQTWLMQHGPHISETHLLTLLKEPNEASNPGWWEQSTRNAFEQALRLWAANDNAAVVAKLLSRDAAAANKYLPTVSSGDAVEDILLASATKLNIPSALTVKDLCLRQGWYKLYAELLLIEDPASAVRNLLSVTPHVSSPSAYMLLAQERGVADFIDVASTSDEEQVKDIVADILVRRHYVFGLSDLDSPSHVDLWLRAIDHGTAADYPQHEAAQIFDALWNHKDVDDQYRALAVKLISANRRAALGSSKSIPIWEISPPDTQTILEVLADEWYANFRSGDIVQATADLRTHIIGPARVNEFLKNLPLSNLRLGIRLFEVLPELGQDQFEYFLVRGLDHGRLPYEAAHSAIDLIVNRGWHDLANRLAQKIKGYSADATLDLLNRGATKLWPMLDPKQRFQVASKSRWRGPEPSDDDWWSAFETVAAELYDSGPSERALWERSRGKNADLALAATGQQQWSQAIRLMKSGGGGVGLDYLLKHMRADFRNNDLLDTLYWNRP